MDDYGYDLGAYGWPISTGSAEAQRWFDRGVNWTFGFNHEEAIACFRRAAEADPDAAMPYWGIAYATGPNYNLPWELYDERGRAKALAGAFEATQAALARIAGATPLEAALIRALPARYPQAGLSDDMAAWDRAFSQEMRAVHAAFPDSLDAASVFAESLLTLTPWQMWDLPRACPAEGAATDEARAVLEGALARQGGMAHPGLLHLYVHLMEMSPFPEKAMKAADVLRTLVPDAGHLVHMPTHIDVLCGNYHDVVFWNERAIEADLKYFAREGAYNFYTGYRQHNYHFVVYGAMFLGQIEPALRAIRGMAETVPEDMLRIQSPPMADYFESFMGLEPHVLIRFGKWHEAIRLEPPADRDLYRCWTAMTYYARAVGNAALGRVKQAEAEEALFLEAAARVPDTRLLHNNKVVDLLEIAKEMVRGEIEYRKGSHAVAFAHLRGSVQLEDALPYDEPWGWMQPARHALGALLFEQGEIAEAEVVYREDLGLGGQLSRATVHPDNVWSLRGLHDCLEARGEIIERAQVKLRLDLAMARADARVGASCFCAQAAMRDLVMPA